MKSHLKMDTGEIVNTLLVRGTLLDGGIYFACQCRGGVWRRAVVMYGKSGTLNVPSVGTENSHAKSNETFGSCL